MWSCKATWIPTAVEVVYWDFKMASLYWIWCSVGIGVDRGMAAQLPLHISFFQFSFKTAFLNLWNCLTSFWWSEGWIYLLNNNLLLLVSFTHILYQHGLRFPLLLQPHPHLWADTTVFYEESDYQNVQTKKSLKLSDTNIFLSIWPPIHFSNANNPVFSYNFINNPDGLISLANSFLTIFLVPQYFLCLKKYEAIKIFLTDLPGHFLMQTNLGVSSWCNG